MGKFKCRVWLSDDKYKQNEQMLILEEFKYPLEFWRNYYNWRGSIKVLMLFTGLKDKNGKDVYEGDILKLDYNDDMRVKIIWDNEVAGFLYRNRNDCLMVIYNDQIPKYFIVIGNIYENPELLK